MSKTKHLDRYPLAPSAFAQAEHRCNQISRRADLGLQYKTGPRMGQQLADACALWILDEATRP